MKQLSAQIRRYVLAALLALTVFGISPSVTLAHGTGSAALDIDWPIGFRPRVVQPH